VDGSVESFVLCFVVSIVFLVLEELTFGCWEGYLGFAVVKCLPFSIYRLNQANVM
jgi:hypothetical protein